VPRRIVIGSPHGIATVGILLRERLFMDSCCKISWLLKNSIFYPNSQNLGDTKYLENRESRL
jgi:hypothetical protein